jgi:DNA-binding MarR family transcriptional regulator
MNQRIGRLPLDSAAASAVSSLCRAANVVRNHLTNTLLRERDLSWTELVVLWLVWIFDGLETGQAASAAAIPKSTMTGVAKALAAKGWLARAVDARDHRQVHLRLTSGGLALMEDLYPRFNAAEAAVVARFSRTELPELTSCLRTIAATVEDMEIKYSADS